MTEQSCEYRTIGLGRATSLVVGNIVGSGLLMLPVTLGKFGSLGVIGWAITAIGAVCLSLVFASLSKRFPHIGGPYTYSREAFGDFIGFQMAWSYWIGTWAGNAGLATVFISYLAVFFPELKGNMPLAFGISMILVWGITFINVAGIKESSFVQVAATVLKIIPFVAIGVFGIAFINFDNFLPINPSDVDMWSALGIACALTLYSFLGLESATVPADDVENPEKTIPRATVLGTLISAVIYIWLMVVLIGLMSPDQLTNSHAPFADAAAIIFGDWAKPVIAICALVVVFGTLHGWVFVQGQIPVAAARDGLFPSGFCKMTQHHTPWFSLIVSAALMSGVLFINYQASMAKQFENIVIMTTFAVLLPYLYSAIAEMYFLLRDPGQMEKGRFIRSMIITILSFIYSIIIVLGSGNDAVYFGTIFVFAGFPLYALMKKKCAADNKEASA